MILNHNLLLPSTVIVNKSPLAHPVTMFAEMANLVFKAFEAMKTSCKMKGVAVMRMVPNSYQQLHFHKSSITFLLHHLLEQAT